MVLECISIIFQNGGVVFLYHPCAKNASISELRSLADSCMHRYVLTQYDKLSPAKVSGYKFAVQNLKNNHPWYISVVEIS